MKIILKLQRTYFDKLNMTALVSLSLSKTWGGIILETGSYELKSMAKTNEQEQ